MRIFAPFTSINSIVMHCLPRCVLLETFKGAGRRPYQFLNKGIYDLLLVLGRPQLKRFDRSRAIYGFLESHSGVDMRPRAIAVNAPAGVFQKLSRTVVPLLVKSL